MSRIAILALSISLSVFTLLAADAPNPFQETLSRVTPAELPAKAADIIKSVKNRERTTTTINVVKAAVTINPAAAPVIVGSIARSLPELAAIAAGAAAGEQPRQASAIARAASAAAPSKAGKIVVAVCRAVPNEYAAIATAVAQVVPDSTREILASVATALPELKDSIEKALANYRGQPSVAVVLADAAKLGTSVGNQPLSSLSATPIAGRPLASAGASSASSSGTGARGPAVGPPYIPLTGTPGNISPTNSGVVPTGGRNYAEP
jgi:hypothetical protein